MVSIPTQGVHSGKTLIQAYPQFRTKFNLRLQLPPGYGPYMRLKNTDNPVRTTVGIYLTVSISFSHFFRLWFNMPLSVGLGNILIRNSGVSLHLSFVYRRWVIPFIFMLLVISGIILLTDCLDQVYIQRIKNISTDSFP